MMSPGVQSGRWSPARGNVIRWSSAIPFSMCIVKCVMPRSTFLPWHTWHVLVMILPRPPHFGHLCPAGNAYAP
jgi:hypothetical protein